MQSFLCFILVVFSLPSWANGNFLICSDLFAPKLELPLSLVELDRQVAPTLLKISIQTMADTILYTAQNKMAYEGFSPNLINTLRRTLEIHLVAEKVQELAERPYKNEVLRRAGIRPLAPISVLGQEIDLDFFGIEASMDPNLLRDLDDKALARATWLAADAVKDLYLQQAQQEDLFLDIGLNRSVDKLLNVGHQKNYPVSEIYDLEGRQNDASIFLMFASFIREALVREEVTNLMDKGRLHWPKKRKVVDNQILLLAAYPELLPFVGRLADFDFRYALDFSALDSLHSTSYAVLKSGPGMANLSLKRELEHSSSDYMEWLEASIEVIVFEPKDRQMGHHNHVSLHASLRSSWQEFLASRSHDKDQWRLVVSGDDKVLNLTVESSDWSVSEFEVLAEFYLDLVSQDRRDEFGQQLRPMSRL